MTLFSTPLCALRTCGMALAAALLLPGCASLSPAPPVDILPTTPPAISTAPRAPAPVTGSLYHQATYRPAFEDRRARMVGDNVTILIVENVTASQKSSSSANRSSSMDAGVSAFPFASATTLGKLSLNSSTNNDFAGAGATESANRFSGSITTTVVEVLPNGHLVVTGEKQIGVNQNVDVLRFSGTVDPLAIQAGGMVSSTSVANARIESRGRGAQNEAQTVGWIARFFMALMPF